MSLEVLKVVDTTEEDDAKTTTKEKTTTTTSGRKPGKKDEKDAKEMTTTSLVNSLKKGALMEEERCFNAAVASPYGDGVLSKKDARILKRKARWKAKVEEAKKRKKTLQRTKETQGEDDDEEKEEDTGEELEFDPIAYCCEYTEYGNYVELKKDYDVDGFGILELNTTVLKIPNTSGFIIQNY